MSLISKQWVGSTVFLFVLAGLCFGLMNWRTERMISSAYESCGSPEPISMSELGLSAAQQAQIRSLQETYRTRIVDLCVKHCDQKRRLAELLAASPRSDDAILT